MVIQLIEVTHPHLAVSATPAKNIIASGSLFNGKNSKKYYC